MFHRIALVRKRRTCQAQCLYGKPYHKIALFIKKAPAICTLKTSEQELALLFKRAFSLSFSLFDIVIQVLDLVTLPFATSEVALAL